MVSSYEIGLSNMMQLIKMTWERSVTWDRDTYLILAVVKGWNIPQSLTDEIFVVSRSIDDLDTT